MPKIRGIPEAYWSVTVQAIGPEVIYEGEFPARSRDYYAIAQGGAAFAYVYLLLDEFDRVLYVGRARRPGNRFDKHRRQKAWWGDVRGLVVLGVVGHDRADAHALVSYLERYTIRKLSPVYNIVGVAA